MDIFGGSVSVYLSDIESKIGVLGGLEDAVLIEVNDSSTAALIAHHNQTKKYCFLAGGHRLAVVKRNLRAFRNALKKLGYVLP